MDWCFPVDSQALIVPSLRFLLWFGGSRGWHSVIRSKIMPGLGFPVAVLLPRGENLLCYPSLTEGSGGLGKGGHPAKWWCSQKWNQGLLLMERNWSDWSIFVFSRVQDGKTAWEIGHFVNQAVPENEGYLVKKQSVGPKMTGVTGILSMGANLCLTVVGKRQDNTPQTVSHLKLCNKYSSLRACSAVGFPCGKYSLLVMKRCKTPIF